MTLAILQILHIQNLNKEERTRYKLHIHQNGFSEQLASLSSTSASFSWEIRSSSTSNLSSVPTSVYLAFVFPCPLSLRLASSSQAIFAILTTQFFFMKSFDKFSSSSKQDTSAWIDRVSTAASSRNRAIGFPCKGMEI